MYDFLLNFFIKLAIFEIIQKIVIHFKTEKVLYFRKVIDCTKFKNIVILIVKYTNRIKVLLFLRKKNYGIILKKGE